MSGPRPLRIGTRRSPLALAQAREVVDRLANAGRAAELVPMATAGDLPGSRPGELGVKGLFVDDIARALREGEVDLAVHSAKDLPAADPEGLVLAAVPERADPRDVLIGVPGGELPPGARVGTSSLRRRAQLLHVRPDLRVVPVRGNVGTRLARLGSGEVDALVLAAAGLARLGIEPPDAVPLAPARMTPAPGQGALAVQARGADAPTLAALVSLDHAPSRRALAAERALVRLLGGGCALPLGALAEERGGTVRISAVVMGVAAGEVVAATAESPEPEAAAAEVARLLLEGGAGPILAAAGAGPRDEWNRATGGGAPG